MTAAGSSRQRARVERERLAELQAIAATRALSPAEAEEAAALGKREAVRAGRRERQRRYAAANPDKVRARLARWRETPGNVDRIRAARARYLEANRDEQNARRNARRKALRALLRGPAVPRDLADWGDITEQRRREREREATRLLGAACQAAALRLARSRSTNAEARGLRAVTTARELVHETR